MGVGVVGPLGAPVFRGRKQGAENAITHLPERAGNPVLENPRKAAPARMRSCSIYGNGGQISWKLQRIWCSLQ